MQCGHATSLVGTNDVPPHFGSGSSLRLWCEACRSDRPAVGYQEAGRVDVSADFFSGPLVLSQVRLRSIQTGS